VSERVTLSISEVDDLASAALRANGVAEEHTRAIADIVAAAERDGAVSHGLFRIPGYIRSVRSGKVVTDAVPVLRDLAPAVLRVDAAYGFAPLALKVGREPLAQRAREQGIAALAVVNCYHFAALWPEVEALAEQGLVAFAFTNSFSYVAPAGGTERLYGTNPMAFAWPRVGQPPVVFDQASSASARGEIMLAQRDGLEIPEGWAIDQHGDPTTDPTEALGGAQLPFGGYKGAAIALMVELLASALIGDVLSFEASARDNNDGGPPVGGEFVIAIDPARCVSGGDGYAVLAHAERLFEKILQQEGTRLPSDRRYRNRQRTLVEGTSIPRDLYQSLEELCSTARGGS